MKILGHFLKQYKRFYRKLQYLFFVKSIFKDKNEYKKYLNFKSSDIPDSIVHLGMRETGIQPISARLHASDLTVLVDTFLGKYHLPLVNLGTSPIILDLGSNVGYTMLHYKYLYPNAQIFGVEMDYDNFSIASENIKFYQNCRIINAAVWTEDTIVNYNGKNNESFHISSFEEGKQVKALSINSIFNEFNIKDVDLVKMDIEGAEEEIFNKPLDWLKNIKYLLLEVHNQNVDFYFKKLEKEGFRCRLHSKHWSSIWATKKVRT